MRLSLVPIAITVLSATLGGVLGARAADAPRKVFNVAHRGASGLAPEHTVAAYDLALKMGADYIEQDLGMTSDGHLIALHDSTLDRTARGPAEDCSGPVRLKTLEQVKKCDVGSWFNEAYPMAARSEYEGLQIPTLEEIFKRYGKNVNYYIETKDPELYPDMEEKLLALMAKYGLTKPARSDWRVLIQSFVPASLQRIHALDPALPLVQLYPRMGSANVQATLDNAASYSVGIGPSSGDVDEDLVAAAHERCLQLHPYTVNSRDEMRRLTDLGVDGMFTNFPRRLNRVLGPEEVKRPLRVAHTTAEVQAECSS